MKRTSEKRNSSVQFSFNENSTVLDLISFITAAIWNDPNFFIGNTSFAFLVDNERLYPDYDVCFSKILNKYLDPKNSGTITLSILVSHDAGDVGFEYPLRFYVQSREAGSHHEAHIHVEDTSHQYSASIRISDGEVIAGELPKKLAKLAKKKILSDQKYFYKCWNTQTDGLQVDINKHLGLIQY